MRFPCPRLPIRVDRIPNQHEHHHDYDKDDKTDNRKALLKVLVNTILDFVCSCLNDSDLYITNTIRLYLQQILGFSYSNLFEVCFGALSQCPECTALGTIP